MRARRFIIAAAAVIALLAAGTAAGAAIASGPVDSSGVIHGCWTTTAIHGSHAFVLQDAGTTCPKGTMAISWNRQGPAGPAGPAGAPGTGATVASEPAGANCTSGGVSVTDGSGTTGYVCNGAAGPPGPPGPDVLVYGEISVNSLGATGCAFSFGPFGPGASNLTVSLDEANLTCVLKGMPASFMPATLPARAVVSSARDEITFPIINFPGVYDFVLLVPES